MSANRYSTVETSEPVRHDSRTLGTKRTGSNVRKRMVIAAAAELDPHLARLEREGRRYGLRAAKRAIRRLAADVR